MPQPTLRDQRIVIVGGSSGIGLAVAEGALAEGAKVFIGSSRQATVDAGLSTLGEGAQGATIEARDEASIAAFFERAGPLDHLVYTAGDWDRATNGMSVGSLDVDAAISGMRVRFWGALLAIKHAKPRLSETGSITLTDGTLAHRPLKGSPLSTAFAGALEHLVRGLAVDLAPLRVNAVCPGLTMTGATANFPAQALAAFTRRCLIPRGGEPAEVAQAYLYAMRGTYTTGQVLIVDGGSLLG